MHELEERLIGKNGNDHEREGARTSGDTDRSWPSSRRSLTAQPRLLRKHGNSTVVPQEAAEPFYRPHCRSTAAAYTSSWRSDTSAPSQRLLRGSSRRCA